ncbi:inorganic phosphate transporter [Corynebacterium bovis]|uniref:Phosphate transporter n=3 Tax=Corynebacterium bovis TaxID=36808 RepID=A0A3R8RGU2_9CORY|nr:inorganic phosphate transporter [Corynebacterium bovis]MBB3116635.1 PiT family inorganic phosphate transporter [Corynebacterium bovis DSM 20582 = CIP 54.80]MDK8511050.1 inorganic phosphate transporter [Corynebacterium bovis]QQC47188.1 inorganic phosphate transporter [Corynebacterium bovis]RRO79241.1 inorganic phosphate transporter [Corynebacterium bovis]RRO79623.1 inorganic phosphate transporter [Corynebacterium bovis]
MTELIILLLVIGTALAFDFTNGFHDTANAMATSIATGALRPKVAVALAGVLNLIGAFLSVEVAKTVAKGIVNLDSFDLSVTAQADNLLLVVFAGLVGGISWNLLTWLFGIPSSSSHALFGGLIGAAIGALGFSGVMWSGVMQKIVVPAVAAPVVAGIVAALGTAGVYAFTKRVEANSRDRYFRWGQIGSASLVALAHGTSDAQKTMGVIFLALVASGHLDSAADMPFWVTAACALAIAAGTYTGGWRVIRTLGKGLVEITSPQGMAAETSSAAIILTSSHLGMALSTTHVATGSILGTGLGRPGAEVRWGVAGRMAVAWVTTLPVAAALSWLVYIVSNAAADATSMLIGSVVALIILLVIVGAVILRARANPVHAGNVNEDWDEETHSPVPPTRKAPALAGAGHGDPATFVDTSAGIDGLPGAADAPAHPAAPTTPIRKDI